MANPKCQFCGEPIDRTIAFVIDKGYRKLYYCSEEEYKVSNRNKEKKKKEQEAINEVKKEVFNLVDMLFGKHITNTIMFSEMNKLAATYKYDYILRYLKENEDYLYGILRNKTFASEYGKIKYFLAILANSLSDFTDNIKEDEEFVPKDLHLEILEFKYKPRKARRSLAEIEEEVILEDE